MDSNFRNACRGVLRRRSALALIAGAAMVVASIAGSAPAAHAQTVINVTVGNDPGTSSGGATGGPGTLSAALAQVNASTPPGGFIINLQTNVTLSGPLSPIFNSVTINGGGFTISGNNTTRIFMIGVDSATQTSAAVAGSIIAQRPQVMISNVTLSSGLAQGGGGASGGGGGMGAGAALFVNQLSGVTFSGNKAVGGNGGTSPTPAGGGGGLGGVGGVYVGVGPGGGGRHVRERHYQQCQPQWRRRWPLWWRWRLNRLLRLRWCRRWRLYRKRRQWAQSKWTERHLGNRRPQRRRRKRWRGGRNWRQHRWRRRWRALR
jgi:hypothetical protein